MYKQHENSLNTATTFTLCLTSLIFQFSRVTPG